MHGFAGHEPLIEERLKGPIGRWADVVVCEHRGTLTMRIDARNGAVPGDPWPYSDGFQMRLALAHPASSCVEGRWRCDGFLKPWDLETGDSYYDGPFKSAFWWLSHELWDTDFATVPQSQVWPGLDGPLRQHDHGVHSRMEEICRIAAIRAVALCDPRARDAVMPLDPEARFFVYAALLSDPSGRIEQMLDTCPGLLALASLLGTEHPTAQQLIKDIRRGRKLGELFDLVLPETAARHVPIGANLLRSRRSGALVRRAPRLSAQELLGILHAPGIDVNDIPRSKDDTETWFQAMVEWAQASAKMGDLIAARQLGGFWSKYAVSLRQWDDLHIEIAELLDWLRVTMAAVPTRRSSPARVRRAIDEWHGRVAVVAHQPGTPLAEGPTATHVVHGIEVCPIETIGRLVKEGIEMRSCVMMFADAAILGSIFFYRARIGGAQATIAITGSTGHWHLHEASGLANRKLDVEERVAIARWMKCLR